MDELQEQGIFNQIKPVQKYSEEEKGLLTKHEKYLLEILEDGRYPEFIKEAVKNKKVIVVAGETGSGKTSFMKTIVNHIPKNHRIITIEDVHELFLPNHDNRIHLHYPSEGKKDRATSTPSTQLKNCLRLKPSRILIAELRGAEAYDFIDAAMSGHDGSITSCHAGSPQLTIERLINMMRKHEEGKSLPYDVLKTTIYQTVDVIVHYHKDEDTRERYITEIWYDPKMKRAKLTND